METKLTPEQITQFLNKPPTNPALQAIDAAPNAQYQVSDLKQMMNHNTGKIKILKKDIESKVVVIKPNQESV